MWDSLQSNLAIRNSQGTKQIARDRKLFEIRRRWLLSFFCQVSAQGRQMKGCQEKLLRSNKQSRTKETQKI